MRRLFIKTLFGVLIGGGLVSVYPSQLKNSDLWIVKIDSAGDTLWTRSYGVGIDFVEIGWSTLVPVGNEDGLWIEEMSDGFIVAGHIDGHPWILKTDKNGDTLWTKILLTNQYAIIPRVDYNEEILISMPTDSTIYVQDTNRNFFPPLVNFSTVVYGYAYAPFVLDRDGRSLGFILRDFLADSSLYFSAISPTRDSNYVLGGRIESPTGEYGDVWLGKVDREGKVLGSRRVHLEIDSCGRGEVKVRDVFETSDGLFAVYGLVDESPWLLINDSVFYSAWEMVLPISVGADKMYIQEIPDGGYIGSIRSSDFSSVFEVDPTYLHYLPIWMDIKCAQQKFEFISPAYEGGYIATGKNDLNLWVVKFSSQGIVEWERTNHIGDYSCGYCIRPTSDMGYIIVGTIDRLFFY